MISKVISDDIPPQMNIMNMINSHFYALLQFRLILERFKHGIQRQVTQLMSSNRFLQYVAG